MESYIFGNENYSDPLCLQFTNTLKWHASQSPVETLNAFTDFVSWAQKAGIAKKKDADQLTAWAEENPTQAERALRRLITLREAIYRIIVASINEKRAEDADLQEMNAALEKPTDGAGISRTGGGFAWEWKLDKSSPDWLAGAIALSTANLLVSDRLKRVGQCADEDGCGWLFLDTTKNHSRRWCDVKDCGNRDRQRRYQERIRAEK